MKASQNQTKEVTTSWKKSYESTLCSPADTSFIASGKLTLGWRLDGNIDNGATSKAWALTHSQATVIINSYPGTDGDMTFSGDWSISRRQEQTLSHALNISWPPGYTISYTAGDDTWTCGEDSKDRPFEMDFSSNGHDTVYTKSIQFAKARSAYDTKALHAYTMGNAFMSTDVALVEGP